jgi:hypothetical protein
MSKKQEYSFIKSIIYECPLNRMALPEGLPWTLF